nr:DUF4236 domain-containing protein [Frankia tisae]
MSTLSCSSSPGRISWRVWSRNRRGGLSSVDLPGPFSYRREGRGRRRAES